MCFNIKLLGIFFFLNALNISLSVSLVPALGQDFRKAFPTTLWVWALPFRSPYMDSPKTWKHLEIKSL